MCGIVGYIGSNKAVPILINGLLSLEYRGYDSAGLAVLNKKNDKYELKIVKDKGRVNVLQNNKELADLDGCIGIAHTRWATHGVPSKLNAHPHTDKFNEFSVVHNGIIENYIELKQLLNNKGYSLQSDTDTEVIPNLIHMNFHGDILSALATTLKQLKGSYAIEVISPLFPDQIIVARKDSPLVIGRGKNENFIASDIPAILSHTNNFYFIDDNEIAVVKKDEIKFYDFDLNIISKDLKNIEWDASKVEKAGYNDYMLKEIYEQPTAVRETLGSRLTLNNRIDLGLNNIDFKKFNKIYIVACGTAMHSGLATKYTFEKYCKIDTFVDMASEFRYRQPLIDENTLCIFVSQSGETADTIAALKLSKSAGCTTISVVNVIGSSITRISDYTIYTHAGPEIAVASTKAYTCQLTLLNMLALNIAEALNSSPATEINEMKEELLSLPDKIKHTLESTDSLKEFAHKIYSQKDIFFIGRGTDYAVSMEGSLKLKEISYIHSEAYASGELKHGPIALIEKGVTVIGIATDSITTPKTLSNLEEVITRGAMVLMITNQNITNDKIDVQINIPEVNEYLSPVLSVLPLQLLAYYISKEKKLDVDKPRNLAKSVTVE